MAKESIIQVKSYDFAVKIVLLCRNLAETKKEFVLSKQLLRSGTSIGANIEEALGGQSERDFYAKMNIAHKECRETHYWLRLLKDTNILDENTAQNYIQDCDELKKISASIIKTLKDKFNSKTTPNS